MDHPVRIALLASALSLVACQRQPSEQPASPPAQFPANDANPAPEPLSGPDTTPAVAEPVGTNPNKAYPFAGENDGFPDLTPARVPSEAAKGVIGARAVLLPWARGIELREFDQSWAMMGDAAKAQVSKVQFNAMFHPLRDLFVRLPEGTMEGAAGSSFYTVPTTVTGTRADGTKVTYKGDVVVRRVNDVPGATAEQLAWHIVQLILKPS